MKRTIKTQIVFLTRRLIHLTGIIIFSANLWLGLACETSEHLNNLMLPDLAGQQIDTQNLPGKIRVFVFFSPLDCHACLNELEFWERICHTFLPEELSVVGVGNAFHPNMLIAFQRAHNLSFTILYDAKGRKAAELQITQTPLRILCDRSGRILHKSTGAVSWFKHDQAVTYLKSLIKEQV